MCVYGILFNLYILTISTYLRKIAVIPLLLIMLFNLFGYQLIVQLMQENVSSKLEASLDKNEYDEAKLIEIRIPLNMPYQERYTEFERHYGEITIDGELYNYVKRKIAGDVLILKCIPNISGQALNNIKHDIAKSNSAADADRPEKNSPVKSFTKNSIDDFDGKHLFPQFSFAANSIESFYADYRFIIPLGISLSIYQPPKNC